MQTTLNMSFTNEAIIITIWEKGKDNCFANSTTFISSPQSA